MILLFIVALSVATAETISRKPVALTMYTNATLTPNQPPLKISGIWKGNESFAIVIEGTAINTQMLFSSKESGRFAIDVGASGTLAATVACEFVEDEEPQIKDKIPAYETNRLMVETGGRASLRSVAQGTYLRAWDDEKLKGGPEGGVDMAPNKTTWTNWNIVQKGYNIRFKSIHNPSRFLRTSKNGTLELFKDETALWDAYLPLRNSDGSWSFRSSTNEKFLSAGDDGTITTSVKTGKREMFWLEKWSARENFAPATKRTVEVSLVPQSSAHISGYWSKNKSFVIEVRGDTVNTSMTFRHEEKESFEIIIDANGDKKTKHHDGSISASEDRTEVVEHKHGEEWNTTRFWAEVGRSGLKIRSVHGTCLRVGDVLENGPGGWFNSKMAECTETFFFEDQFDSGKVMFTADHLPECFLSPEEIGTVRFTNLRWFYWAPFKNDDGSWSFYGPDGQWLSARKDGTARTVEYCGTNEHFWLDK